MDHLSLFAGVISAARGENPPVVDSGFAVTWAADQFLAREQLILQQGNTLFPRDDGWYSHSVIVMPIHNEDIQRNPQGFLHLYLVRIFKRVEGLVAMTKVLFGYDITDNQKPSEDKIQFFLSTSNSVYPESDNWEHHADTYTLRFHLDPVSQSLLN
jgi:hypothetical protein